MEFAGLRFEDVLAELMGLIGVPLRNAAPAAKWRGGAGPRRLAGSPVLSVEFSWRGGGEGEAPGHVELDFAVGQDVGPEQRGQGAEVFGGEDVGPFGFGEDVLDHQRVDVDERGWLPVDDRSRTSRDARDRQKHDPLLGGWCHVP